MNKKNIIIILILILISHNFAFSKDFDFSKTFDISLKMPKKEIFKLFDKNKLKYKKGETKYKQEYYSLLEKTNIYNAKIDQLEVGFKSDSVDFISFDIADTDINNFASAIRESANCYEDIRDVGFRLTIFYFDNCALSLVYFLDVGKTSFGFIDNNIKICEKK